ncbi:MAG: hypothetical protein JWN76_1912 [Chitinophagaceae bacterium]|nr:hypothetical protein [Chitinophagaceae bacterium]
MPRIIYPALNYLNYQMKYSILLSLLLFSLFSFESCGKKQKAVSATVTPGILRGVWELRHINGGFRAPGDFAPGNGYVYEFSDSAFKHFEQQKVNDQGSYSIMKDTFYDRVTIMDRIMFSNHNDKQFIKIKDTRLILYYGMIAADGTEETYEKIADAPGADH